MSKRREYNRAILGTGWDYGRGIFGRQVFYRISANQVDFFCLNRVLGLRFLQIVTEVIFSYIRDCF
jgi:hypothetical protein